MDGTAPRPEPWYAKGLRFACQRSGKCCVNHGDYAYVYLTPEDEARMVEHLGLTLEDFRTRYTETGEAGERVLRSAGPACVFLENGHDCSVYAARPVQCATWPFWPSTVATEGAWKREILSFCPGAGKGKLHTREEIDAIKERAR